MSYEYENIASDTIRNICQPNGCIFARKPSPHNSLYSCNAQPPRGVYDAFEVYDECHRAVLLSTKKNRSLVSGIMTKQGFTHIPFETRVERKKRISWARFDLR